MPTLTDLVRERTGLSPADTEWLHLLVADWQLLADLSFADLVLWVRAADRSWVAVAQMRPTTGPTVYYDDLVGDVVGAGCRPQLDAAADEARIWREGDPDWRDDVPVREETIPVVRDGMVLAVVARQTNLSTTRTPSRLELTYLACADDLARMIAEGAFPISDGQVGGRRGAPRVGDGLIRLDRDGAVTYASPNAVSAYRRLGLTADLVGAHLGAVTTALAPQQGAVDEALSVVVSGRAPRRVDVEANANVVALRAIPVRLQGVRVGGLVLCRDVTELRRRERELVTKDATIREIHHRVKNNLQTVAALLRLQARRLEEPTGRAALEEAVRRVGAIALVHEVLSRALDETVLFDDIAEQISSSMVDVAVVPGGSGQVSVRREGEFGTLPAEVATPLALALTELLQNALEHGAPDGGVVTVRAQRDGARLRVAVVDAGPGLPADFDLDRSRSLGLQIVRALVEAELDGALELAGAAGGGTVARLELLVPEA